MKFCKDCNYFRLSPNSMAMCYHPSSVTKIDLVFGEKQYTPAEVMRDNKSRCGNVGKFFEPIGSNP